MNRIRELRQARGWTQAQLGARVGMAKTTISGYEKGDHQVDPEMICKLCDLFGCTADYLLGRTESPLPVISDEDARILAVLGHTVGAQEDVVSLALLEQLEGNDLDAAAKSKDSET